MILHVDRVRDDQQNQTRKGRGARRSLPGLFAFGPRGDEPPERQLLQSQLVSAPPCSRDQIEIPTRRNAAPSSPRVSRGVGDVQIGGEFANLRPDVSEVFHTFETTQSAQLGQGAKCRVRFAGRESTIRRIKEARLLEDQEDKTEAVAARLKAAREALQMSKRDFAERAGMGEQTYGPFENGKRPLSLEAAKKLRKAYGLTLEFMYFGKIDDLPHKIAARL